MKYEKLDAQQKLSKAEEKKIDNYEEILQSVNSLKEEKTKLLDRLSEADKSLLDLSKRVHPNPDDNVKSESEYSSTKKIDHINLSLDEIKSVLKMLPQRSQAPTNDLELRQVQAELQQSKLQLVEEKAKVLQLKSNLTELKDMIADDDFIHNQHDAKQKQLQHLRSKHQHCIRNEKLRRQVQKEKKLLQRKHSTLQKQYQMLSALYQSSQSDLSYKEQIVAELVAAKKNQANESKTLKDQLESSKSFISENNVLLEKYKRESSYLLEKLNTGNEEKVELKKKNESLEQRLSQLSALDDVKKNLDFIRENLLEMKSTSNNSTKTNESSQSDMDVLTQRNIDLADKILSLQYRLSTDQQEFEKLQRSVESKNKNINSYQQHIERLENKIACESSQSALQKAMKVSEYETKIENLTLEKEILTSRVLILEGIREEMNVLKKERNLLKLENQKLRRLNEQRNFSSGSYLNAVNAADEMFSGNELSDSPSEATSDTHFEENLKKLDELDEGTKSRLQQMLSTPEFESFLSTDDVRIDLKDTNSQQSSDHSSDRISIQESLKNLSADSFEPEHTIKHMFQTDSGNVQTETFGECTSFEDVIQVYTPPVDYPSALSNKDEDTINYSQEKQPPQNASDSGVDTPQSTQTNNLEKLVSESQLISKSIASKRETSGNIDYKKVLNELHKAITEMSRDTSSHSSLEDRKLSAHSSRQKKVTFSDHVVDFYSEVESEDNTSSSSLPSMESSDSNFYRSFFHDALIKTYPELTKDEEGEDSSDENRYFDNLTVDQMLSQNSLANTEDSVVGILHNDSVPTMKTSSNREPDALAVSSR